MRRIDMFVGKLRRFKGERIINGVVIASTTKQSVRMMRWYLSTIPLVKLNDEVEFKVLSINDTDCFVSLAMTAIYIFFI